MNRILRLFFFLATVYVMSAINLNSQIPCYQAGDITIDIIDVNCGANGGQQEEYIIIEIGGTGTVDLEGYIVDDNNAPAIGVGNSDGHARFPGGVFNSVPAGTQICIYSLALPDGYQEDADHWLLNIRDMVIHNQCPNFDYPGYECSENGSASWLSLLALSNEGDICQIRTPLGERIAVWKCGLFDPNPNARYSSFEDEEDEPESVNPNQRLQLGGFGVTGDYVICPSATSATLEAFGGISYEWYFEGVLISSDAIVTVAADHLDEFQVEITLEQNCYVTEYVTIVKQTNPESCNGKDDNCDGIVDNDCSDIDPEIAIQNCSTLEVIEVDACVIPEYSWEYQINNLGWQIVTNNTSKILEFSQITLPDGSITSLDFRVTVSVEGCDDEISDVLHLDSNSGLTENSCGELIFLYESDICVLKPQIVDPPLLLIDDCGPIYLDFQGEICKSIERIEWKFKINLNDDWSNVIVNSHSELSLLPEAPGYYMADITYNDGSTNSSNSINLVTLIEGIPAYSIQQFNGTCDYNPFIIVQLEEITVGNRIDVIVEEESIHEYTVDSQNPELKITLSGEGAYTVKVRSLEYNCYSNEHVITVTDEDCSSCSGNGLKCNPDDLVCEAINFLQFKVDDIRILEVFVSPDFNNWLAENSISQNQLFESLQDFESVTIAIIPKDNQESLAFFGNDAETQSIPANDLNSLFVGGSIFIPTFYANYLLREVRVDAIKASTNSAIECSSNNLSMLPDDDVENRDFDDIELSCSQFGCGQNGNSDVTEFEITGGELPMLLNISETRNDDVQIHTQVIINDENDRRYIYVGDKTSSINGTLTDLEGNSFASLENLLNGFCFSIRLPNLTNEELVYHLESGLPTTVTLTEVLNSFDCLDILDEACVYWVVNGEYVDALSLDINDGDEISVSITINGTVIGDIPVTNDGDDDGVPDESCSEDYDNDGIPDCQDEDDDGDGVNNIDEDTNGDGDPTNDDSNDDGIPDYLDPNEDTNITEECSAVEIENIIKTNADCTNPTQGQLEIISAQAGVEYSIDGGATWVTQNTFIIDIDVPYTVMIRIGFCVDQEDNVTVNSNCYEICDNCIDDDGDGLVDCFDTTCPCLENDTDGDGILDHCDVEDCFDGVDNDGDGFEDCKDLGCIIITNTQNSINNNLKALNNCLADAELIDYIQQLYDRGISSRCNSLSSEELLNVVLNNCGDNCNLENFMSELFKEDYVLPTQVFLDDSKGGCIFEKFKTNLPNVCALLSNFISTDNRNAVFHIQDVGDRNATTDPPNSESSNYNISLNPEYLNIACEIEIVKTMIHESIHVEIWRIIRNETIEHIQTFYPRLYFHQQNSGNDWQHFYMAEIQHSVIVNSLKAIYFSQFTNREFELLAWSGLTTVINSDPPMTYPGFSESGYSLQDVIDNTAMLRNSCSDSNHRTNNSCDGL